ncbi:hypothetical protein D9V34_15565 [Mycetocola lacteus]|uniref:Antitoxin VbhA domain-containing protein n=1 Tax=Mycetocola lacteus TaxID=76637 RepID=A0A3L7AI21_9MICO|nr:hypothetical protein [Mycetocola lacteus]RLP79221.1 hypothetical protein D9V34_15565 [Mycetocola lacteus]
MSDKTDAADGTAAVQRLPSHPDSETTNLSADAIEHVAFADAALALAGHELSDPVLRALLEQVARGKLSGDAAVSEMRRNVGS